MGGGITLVCSVIFYRSVKSLTLFYSLGLKSIDSELDILLSKDYKNPMIDVCT